MLDYLVFIMYVFETVLEFLLRLALRSPNRLGLFLASGLPCLI